MVETLGFFGMGFALGAVLQGFVALIGLRVVLKHLADNTQVGGIPAVVAKERASVEAERDRARIARADALGIKLKSNFQD